MTRISLVLDHLQLSFQALKERIERLKARGSTNAVFTSETEFSQEMMEIRKDFVSIHGEMVLLKNYSSLNFAGYNQPCTCYFVFLTLSTCDSLVYPKFLVFS